MFEFPCHRWLAKDEDDRQITRELVCVNGSQQADMYITPGEPGIYMNKTLFMLDCSISFKLFFLEVQ